MTLVVGKGEVVRVVWASVSNNSIVQVIVQTLSILGNIHTLTLAIGCRIAVGAGPISFVLGTASNTEYSDST